MSLRNGSYNILYGGCRFLDKAAVETEEDKISGTPVTAWRLCTVTQVS
jgi:hypothetical protein